MRKKNWLRYGMASASIAGLIAGGALVACGDDDSGTSSGGVDGGQDTGNGGDTGVPDTNVPDTNKPPVDPPAKLILVHAGTDLGENNTTDAVRVCFATAPKSAPNDFQVTPFPILPHSPSNDAGTFPFPGIFPGTGGPFPQSGADYEDLVIRPYLMNAETLAARGVLGNAASVPRCNSILKDGYVPDGGFANDAGALQANTDYWQLADIPAGTLQKKKTYMLVVTGCTQDAPVSSVCGPDDTGATFTPTGGAGAKGVGNLKILILELDTTSTVAADELGVQVVHASPQYQILKNGAAVGAFTPLVGNPDAGDAGHFNVSGGNELSYNRDASAPSALAKVKGVITPTGFFAANPDFPPTQGEFIRIALNNTGIPSNPTDPPISIQAASTGDTSTTAYIVNGKTYTFVLVGDPLGAANKKVHYLGFPNDFTPPPLQ